MNLKNSKKWIIDLVNDKIEYLKNYKSPQKTEPVLKIKMH